MKANQTRTYIKKTPENNGYWFELAIYMSWIQFMEFSLFMYQKKYGEKKIIHVMFFCFDSESNEMKLTIFLLCSFLTKTIYESQFFFLCGQSFYSFYVNCFGIIY